ncbi:MAG: UDP-N-acetylmuramoyl-L-alanyl-D-glutamate--2,6-diaminopimelate ligase [Legionellaceae bacterium]|nr:UDP-N-acetylmuramoyl-L-alanyl-D-glutamate--2,6-diaminopimelate ligase [Legionellaceae bacterium]
MNLESLLSSLVDQPILNCEVLGIHNDSRQIKPGFLFVAYPGAISDGRNYIDQAIDLGAVAIVYEPKDFCVSEQSSSKVPHIPIPNLARSMATIAAKFFDYPSKSLSITGITGTNGKTTIAYQLANAHDLMGRSSAYIGTLGQGNIKSLEKLNNTTPDSLCLQSLFANYLDSGVDEVCMEVSSHALQEGRVDEVDFNQAIYTNLSHEHLDYHHTMKAYAEAKSKLFQSPSISVAILNNDCPYVNIMDQARHESCKKITYGLEDGCDVRAINCVYSLSGSEFDIKTSFGSQHVKVKNIGAFNIYNSLAVYCSLLAHGYSSKDVGQVLEKLEPSAGRMEIVANNPCVIVDFAHTPDALKNVLLTLSSLKSMSDTKRNIWAVFGCGGDRDTAKREVMGRIASEFADVVVLTSDNPRTEDPDKIISEIAKGLLSTTRALKFTDRKEAIEQTVSMADTNDIIVIAGKGHEEYQIVGSKKIKFSDKGLVQELLG